MTDHAANKRARRRKSNEKATLAGAFGAPDSHGNVGHSIDDRGHPPTHRKPGQKRAQQVTPRLTRDNGRPSDSIPTWQLGLGIERASGIPIARFREALAAAQHRTDTEKRIIAILAEMFVRAADIGVPVPMMQDALDTSTVTRLLREGRERRQAGVDPWTLEPYPID
jgi:hypothetical protein